MGEEEAYRSYKIKLLNNTFTMTGSHLGIVALGTGLCGAWIKIYNYPPNDLGFYPPKGDRQFKCTKPLLGVLGDNLIWTMPECINCISTLSEDIYEYLYDNKYPGKSSREADHSLPSISR